IRSMQRITGVDPGFDPHNLLTLFINLNASTYSTDPQQIAYFSEALRRLRALPGVKAADMVGCLPINGSCWGSIFTIEGRPVPKRPELPSSQWNVVGSTYFEASTMRIRLLKGRTFQSSDTASSRSVVVINE